MRMFSCFYFPPLRFFSLFLLFVFDRFRLFYLVSHSPTHPPMETEFWAALQMFELLFGAFKFVHSCSQLHPTRGHHHFGRRWFVCGDVFILKSSLPILIIFESFTCYESQFLSYLSHLCVIIFCISCFDFFPQYQIGSDVLSMLQTPSQVWIGE